MPRHADCGHEESKSVVKVDRLAVKIKISFKFTNSEFRFLTDHTLKVLLSLPTKVSDTKFSLVRALFIAEESRKPSFLVNTPLTIISTSTNDDKNFRHLATFWCPNLNVFSSTTDLT